jgi:hypothetical protein
LHLFPWQQFALRKMLGERADGKWAAFEAALIVPRQNGKGAVIEAYELANLFLFDAQLIIHSAHLFPTAQEAFRRLDGLVDETPSLKRLVHKVSNSHGSEGIELKSGARIRFMARTVSGSGRGFSPDRLVLDEAFKLPPEAVAAMLPALSAQPNPQILYTTSTGYPDSDVLWRLVQRGRSGGDGSLCYLEHSAPPGSDLDDRPAWATGNPSAGYLFDEETIARERATLSDEDFGRERLGLWTDTAGDRLIPGAAWIDSLDLKSQIVSAPMFALDVAPSRAWAAIAAAGLNGAGKSHLEVTGRDGVTDHRPGTDWVVPRLVELRLVFPDMRVVIAAGSAAEALKPAVEAAGIPVDVIGARDVAAACGLFYDHVVTSQIAHLGQPCLDAAVAAAKKRVEDGETAWVWGRKRSSADITPLYAATLALWALVGASNLALHPINNVW